jgi:hypothetical protein
VSAEDPHPDDAVDADEFCRAIEAYICRKNDGHLIRISGPAFDMVRGWAEQGMPLKVACAGIDRTFERYYRKGPRRRPVHVTFCEADVLDAFEEWRRAVGVVLRTADEAEPSIVRERPEPGPNPTWGSMSGPADVAGENTHRTRRPASLPAHVERVLSRLTLLRGSERQRGEDWDRALEHAVRSLDTIAATARQARGEARAAIVAELAAIDRLLLACARHALENGESAGLEREAASELAPFRERMSRDAYAAAVQAAADRLLRQAVGLPAIAYTE